MRLKQRSCMALESCKEAAVDMQCPHRKAEAWRRVPWAVFADLFTTVINDCEISRPLIQTSERSSPGLFCGLKVFKYAEAGERERRGGSCPIVASGGPWKAQLSKKGSQAGEAVSITELGARAWLRVPISRLKSGGELPPFLTRS